MPSSRLLGNQELDTLLGFSSPVKELDYLCLGKRRRGRKRGGWLDDKVEEEKVVKALDVRESLLFADCCVSCSGTALAPSPVSPSR